MELKEINGVLCWVKADGGISSQVVSAKAKLKYYGFEFPWNDSGSISIIDGDPAGSGIVLLDVSAGRQSGAYLLRKTSEPGLFDCAYVQKAEIAFASHLIKNPPDADLSLDEIIDRHRAQQRDRVDVKELEQIHGLKVWESSYFDGYWCREAGEFNGLPEAWAILPKGDSMLTRRVRRGPHWALLIKQKRYTVEIGTVAPETNIENAFRDLGGEEAQRQRLANQLKGAEQREQALTEKFRKAIERLYPGMPRQDVDETIAHARRRGAVGAAQWLYFHIAGQGEEAFARAAALAVRAHVRHKYTRYDMILSEPSEDENDFFYADEEHRRAARQQVRDDIETMLHSWRSD